MSRVERIIMITLILLSIGVVLTSFVAPRNKN